MSQQWPGQPVSGGQSQQSRAPGIIRGPAPTVNPAEEQRLQNDQVRIDLAQQAEARQQEKQDRDEARRAAGFDASEGERKSSGFLRRAINAETNFRNLGDVQPRGLVGQAIQDTAPNVSNMMSDADRQRAVQAEREFIAAVLRYDSGAAIPPQEFVTTGQIYFPRPGDTPEALAQKAEARRVALDGLKAAGGRLAAEIEIPSFDDMQTDAASGTGSEEQSPDAANKALGRLLQSGATKDEILALAKDLRLTVDEAALDANIRSRDEGGAISTFVSGGGDTPSPPDDGLTLSQIGQGLAEGTGDIVQGLGGIVGIVADPLARTLSDALGYDSSQLRSTGTAIREDLGLPQSEAGIGRSAREFAAGSLGFAGAARGASNLMANALSRSSLSQVGRTPVRDTVAGAGAGAGSEIGEDLGGTPGQVAGMLAGGIGGYAGANRLASAANRSQPNALLAASQRQNVDLLPADAGGPVAQAVTVGTRASPLSVAPVVKAAENQQQQFGQAARRAAASQGEVLDAEQAGEAIRRGAKNFIEQLRGRGNRLYERAFEQSRGVKIKPNQTAQAVGEAIERMRQNPAATAADIKTLEGFMSNIEGGVSIQGLRDARTALSASVYNGNLRSSSDQAMWKGILSNVADDIDAGLQSVGRDDAARTFRAADKLWSEGIEVIDQVLQPIIGKEGAKGGDQILQSVESAARGQSGGNVRLSRILGAMPKEEAANVRATIADRLGRATPGAQDAQGEVFSASTFLTNWNRLTPQAKTSLFPTKQMRDNLNDLAKIAEGTKRSQAMANTSNTGIAVNSANLGLASVGAVTSLPLTILGAGGVYGTGKLMASPGFARLLARTSKMPPEAANRTFREQLALLSTREPLLADDIAKLTNAINDNGQLAAQDDQSQN